MYPSPPGYCNRCGVDQKHFRTSSVATFGIVDIMGEKRGWKVVRMRKDTFWYGEAGKITRFVKEG